MSSSKLQQNLLKMGENAYMDNTQPHSDTEIDIRAAEFLGNLANHNYSTRSVDGYRLTLKQFTTFMRGRWKRAVLQITPQDLADYRLSLIERKLKQNSLYVYLRVVALFCRYLHEHEHVFVNPAAGMETVGPDRSLQPVPTEDEIRTLLTLPDTSSPLGIRDRALFEVIYSTAARNGETVNMNVKDVDLVAGTIRIMGKGMRERVVPLGKSATEWLTRYLAEVRDTLGGKPEEPALWLNSLGARLSGQVLGIVIKGYARACESIKTEITTHSLRRACATHMLQHGANPPEIQLLLGHGDLSHLRNYLRLTVVDLKAAHQKTAVGE